METENFNADGNAGAEPGASGWTSIRLFRVFNWRNQSRWKAGPDLQLHRSGRREQIYTQGFAVQLGNGNGTFGAPIITTYYSSTNAPTFFL